MYQAVLFDLDGTLLDTARDLVAALNHVREAENLSPLAVAPLASAVSQGALGLITAGMPPADAEQQTRRKRKLLEFYQRNPYRRTCFFPGIEKLLGQLDEQDIPWGIVTNKPAYLTNDIVTRAGLAERLACVVSGDTCARSKPDPEPLLHACRLLRVRPRECVYIGDDPRDSRAARAAGMTALHAAWGYAQAEAGVRLLDDPARLGELLFRR